MPLSTRTGWRPSAEGAPWPSPRPLHRLPGTGGGSATEDTVDAFHEGREHVTLGPARHRSAKRHRAIGHADGDLRKHTDPPDGLVHLSPGLLVVADHGHQQIVAAHDPHQHAGPVHAGRRFTPASSNLRAASRVVASGRTVTTFRVIASPTVRLSATRSSSTNDPGRKIAVRSPAGPEDLRDLRRPLARRDR